MEGVHGFPPEQDQSGGAFFTAPSSVDLAKLIGTTTYAEVPNGLQPNGIVLGTAVFGQGTPCSHFGSRPLGSDAFNGVTYQSVNHLVTTSNPGAAIPEPSAGMLIGVGLAYLSIQRREERLATGRTGVQAAEGILRAA